MKRALLLLLGQWGRSRWTADRWELRNRRLLSLIVERQSFGHVFGEPFDPGLVSGVGREKFLWLFPVR